MNSNDETQIDTTNVGIVGMQGNTVVMLRPMQRFTHEEALNVAAYLVFMSGDYDGEEFAKVFKAIGSA